MRAFGIRMARLLIYKTQNVSALKAHKKVINSICTLYVQAEPAVNSSYQLIGVLNANTGVLKATLTGQQDTSASSLQFEPAFKVLDKPVLLFKFYGVQREDQPYGRSLKRIDVMNKNNGQVMQTLEGFNTFGNSIGFLDVNFDGYYDVVLSDTSDGLKRLCCINLFLRPSLAI